MLRKNKQFGKFKSYTDINNYNNFLLNLDKKFIDDKLTNEKKAQQKEMPTNKRNIIPHINVPILNQNFSGISPIDILLNVIETNLDPNLYKENLEPSLPVKKPQPSKPSSPLPIIRQKVHIDVTINNISDLIKLTDTYKDDVNIEYNINMHILHKIREPLINLNRMIGMKKLKEDIVDQILYYMQNLHTSSNNDFMHTVIYGPPGTGKTEIAKIIGSIFSKMGILNKGTFKKATRSDLIAGYLGQTALKTRDIIKESLGGVLFIDEAYALGNEEKRDSFSKECIDTLCEAASDNKENLMIIVAGYEEELDKCFFSYNAGLSSRFAWRFKTDEYSGEELFKIFLKKVEDAGWTITESINDKWFTKNKEKFRFYGRDIETLFAKAKIAHGRRIFGQSNEVKKQLSVEDLNRGLEIFTNNSSILKANEEENKFKKLMATMYI
jgi:chromosomal replication initiation ATPase DnaA